VELWPLVLNKLDQVDKRQTDVIELRIEAVNPRVTLVRAVHADVQIERLLNPNKGCSCFSDY